MIQIIAVTFATFFGPSPDACYQAQDHHPKPASMIHEGCTSCGEKKKKKKKKHK